MSGLFGKTKNKGGGIFDTFGDKSLTDKERIDSVMLGPDGRNIFTGAFPKGHPQGPRAL